MEKSDTQRGHTSSFISGTLWYIVHYNVLEHSQLVALYNKMIVWLREDPVLLQMFFISYSILMKPQNYLLFGKLSSKIKLVLRLNDQFFKFYAFYKQNLWAAWEGIIQKVKQENNFIT